MSHPKRYDCGMKEETHPDGWNQRWPWMHPSDDGPWVMHSDYAALAAENERLKAEVERLKFELECRQRSYDFMHGQAVERMSEILRLEDENEWLRKADRLVCWNQETKQWEVRHESPR